MRPLALDDTSASARRSPGLLIFADPPHPRHEHHHGCLSNCSFVVSMLLNIVSKFWPYTLL
jgi:hypothetical protein